MNPSDEHTAIARLKRGDIGGLETLVRAYERIAQFDDSRPFAPWFLRSVVNDAVKAVMRRKPPSSARRSTRRARARSSMPGGRTRATAAQS